MKKSTRILLVILLSLALIAISVPKWFPFRSYHYDDASRYTAGSTEISGKVKTIDVSWVAGRVHIDRHGGDEILLSETASRGLKTEEEVHWLLDGDTLYVKYVRAGVKTSSRMDKELTLLLPEGLKLDDVLLSTVSAEVEAELCEAENVKIQSVSGAVDMTLQKTETVNADTVSGDVEVRFADVPDSIDAESVSGDVTIRLPEAAGFDANMDSVSGKIGGDLLDGNDGVKKYTRGNGDCSIRMDSVSGDLRLDAWSR